MKEKVSKRDEFTVFGELVANKLRKCTSSPRSVAVAQRAISDILFNLEMEQFSAMEQTNNAHSTGHYSGNTFAGQFNVPNYNQHFSPNNNRPTSASSSPSILTENVHHFNQPNSIPILHINHFHHLLPPNNTIQQS